MERPSAYWNARSALGTIWNFGTASGLLERAKRLWNGRKALAALVLFVGRRYYLRPISSGTREALLEQALAPGTPSGLLEHPIGLLERAKRLWNGRKALAALVLFVGRRYYLRPISSGTHEALLEQASAPVTPSGLLEHPIGLLERAKRY